MSHSSELLRQVIAEAGDSLEMTAPRAGYIDDDGTVVEIPPGPDGLVHFQWNLNPRPQLNPDFPGQ